MRFNVNKCYAMSMKKQKPAFLQLIWTNNKTSPKQCIPRPPNIRGFKVDSTHCKRNKKGQLDLGFSQKKLKYCPQECKKTAYISLVRSTMEYGGIIWDSYTETNINRLERIQRQTARFITGDYKSREEGSVSYMLLKVELRELKERRTIQKLIFLYKVVQGLVPAIEPDDYLKKTRLKISITAKNIENYQAINIVETGHKAKQWCCSVSVV